MAVNSTSSLIALYVLGVLLEATSLCWYYAPRPATIKITKY